MSQLLWKGKAPPTIISPSFHICRYAGSPCCIQVVPLPLEKLIMAITICKKVKSKGSIYLFSFRMVISVISARSDVLAGWLKMILWHLYKQKKISMGTLHLWHKGGVTKKLGLLFCSCFFHGGLILSLCLMAFRLPFYIEYPLL